MTETDNEPIAPDEKATERVARDGSRRGWPKGKPRGAQAPSAPKAPPKPRTSRQMPISKLQEELKQGAMMVGVGVMLGTGRAAVMTQEVVDVIEVRADKLAASWVTVAQSDARVAEALARLVSGGAWVNAITSTVAFGVTLGTFSGTVRIPIGLATTLVPELRPFTVAPVVPQPPQGPMNGEVPDGSEGP